ncbi:hypothetical protein AWB81_07541 [Caballeronia arationis]|uniref:STAS/SEC14 domain-containing protein n=1 Tax=Caballeronia arationis TaxID=1777142 RepID=UPI00074C0AA8|nr:STAS/SEC14 domain-containing protein [Caballeronia arationis]SAL06336.1 hypothetical protein AWB81_07541 [Caballeronia arationis]
MIEILNNMPDGVAGFAAKGRVTRKDYEDVLIPKMLELLDAHKTVRCYYELGPEFSGMDPGAAWEDFKLGIEHLTRWERLAIVTDVEWIRMTLNIFRFLMPGELRLFATSNAAQARNWIAEANAGANPAL